MLGAQIFWAISLSEFFNRLSRRNPTAGDRRECAPQEMPLGYRVRGRGRESTPALDTGLRRNDKLTFVANQVSK